MCHNTLLCTLSTPTAHINTTVDTNVSMVGP